MIRFPLPTITSTMPSRCWYRPVRNATRVGLQTEELVGSL